MPFHIVETTENAKRLLTSVPSQWVIGDKLYWPRRNYSILKKAEDSVPDENTWKNIKCSIKRPYLRTFEEAELEIALMSDMSDTDLDQDADTRRRQYKTSATVVADFNSLVNDCLSDKSVSLGGMPEMQIVTASDVTDKEDAETSKTAVNGGLLEKMPVEIQQVMEVDLMGASAEKLNTITENLNTIGENLNHLISLSSANETNIHVLFETQQNILQKIAVIDTKFEEFVARSFSTKESDITTKDFKSINSLEELTSFEERLKCPLFTKKMIQALSITCNKSKGQASNNAYLLSDAMFTRDFLTKCSWTGGTRGEPKNCFKAFSSTIDLFFQIVYNSDDTFTKPECESHFKKILKHSIKRNSSKMLRVSSQKKRAKQSKRSQDLDTTGDPQPESNNTIGRSHPEGNNTTGNPQPESNNPDKENLSALDLTS